MAQVASRHPDRFAEITKRLGDLGRNSAWYSGYSSGAKDTAPVIDVDAILARMDAEIATLRQKKLPEDEYAEARNAIYTTYSNMLEKETMKKSLGSDNAFARAVASGARGNPAHVKAILSSPALYTDSKGDLIPLFVRNSFAKGLRPGELLAGTYGARMAVISTKRCLLEGTLVRMADGTAKAIQDVCVGDMVVGVDASGITFPSRVTRVFDQGIQEVHQWDLRFSNSHRVSATVCATEEHRVLMVDSGEHRRATSESRRRGTPRPDKALAHKLGILPLGALGRNRRKLVATKGGRWEGRSEPWALLLGLVTGDGGTTGKANRLSCADPSMLRDVEHYTATLGVQLRKASADPSNYDYALTTRDYTPSMNGGIVRGTQGFVKGAEVELNRQLRAHGLRGKYSWEKMLPPSVWEWDDASVSDYIAAYFACDGSVYATTQKNRGRIQVSISMASTSLALMEGLKVLLAVRFGIHTGAIYKQLNGGFGGGPRKRPIYSILVGRHQCVKRFAALFGPRVPGVKRHKLEELTRDYEQKDNNPNATFSEVGRQYLGKLPCFDIEVDHPDHLFLLANGVTVSNSTAKGGDLGKLLAQNTSNFNVTVKDCQTDNGLDLAADDSSLLGRVLAREAAGLPAGTVLDRQALAAVRKSGKPVIARSAMTCRARHGLCSKCAGVQSDGRFPRIGDSIGVTAGQAVSEPIVQGALSVKHNSGMAQGKKEFSGFDYISQFVQVPTEFKDRAAVAEVDGTVERVEDAPQGGKLITVAGKTHLALPGFEVTVKPGDKVEAGDILSDGLANPSDIVRLRGLGEGRKYYMDRLSKILADSGNPPDRRNMELLARATVDNFVIEDPDEDDPWLPDDDVREGDFMADYRPPTDTAASSLDKSVNGYLQKPVLHYTVGTRITPKIAEHMRGAGVGDVMVSRTAPRFRAEMPRLRVASHSGRDWMQGLGTSYLSSQMQQSVERGDETDVKQNPHFGPRLAYGGDAGAGAFGENIERTGMF